MLTWPLCGTRTCIVRNLCIRSKMNILLAAKLKLMSADVFSSLNQSQHIWILNRIPNLTGIFGICISVRTELGNYLVEAAIPQCKEVEVLHKYLKFQKYSVCRITSRWFTRSMQYKYLTIVLNNMNQPAVADSVQQAAGVQRPTLTQKRKSS